MTHAIRFAVALCTLAIAPTAFADSCKDIHADMTEIRVTTGCDAGEPSCFLGEVDGNHGFRGTTHFRANSGGTPASGSPEWSPYAGSFRYELRDGTLTMVEAGLTGKGQVLAHHEVVSGTGRDHRGFEPSARELGGPADRRFRAGRAEPVARR